MTIKIEKLREFIDSVKEFIEYAERDEILSFIFYHDAIYCVMKQALAELEGKNND